MTRVSGNDHWCDVVVMYKEFRRTMSHAGAIKEIQTKFTGIGPLNQQRLFDSDVGSPTKCDDTFISELDLNLLTCGGGDWNIKKTNMKHSSVVPFGGDTCIKCVYEKDSGTSSDPGIGGFSFSAIPCGMGRDEVSFSWDVFYPKGFDFARGGKHGGVLIGEGVASGYRHSETAATNRVMWQQLGGAIAYIYPPEGLKQEISKLTDEGHGVGFFKEDFAGVLSHDRWHTVELGTKMNTFSRGKPNADGCSKLTIDGTTCEINNIRWSKSPDLKISRLDMNIFFGGPLPSPKRQVCYFKNFRMKKY